MKGTHKRSIFVAAVALIAVATFLVSGQAGRALADEEAGLGDKVAGTYLAVTENGATILQISRDGNLSSILSIQFTGGGVIGESFSNTLGSWKKTGTREITATTVDLNFKSVPGFIGVAFIGVAATTNIMKFDQKFQTGTMTCQGRIFPPGVDPFQLGPTPPIPILDSEFTCGPQGIEFHRIPIAG
jgi:hypothetical protein